MALVPCRECGKEVSTEATACPNCGASVASRPRAKLGCGGVSVILILALFAIFEFGINTGGDGGGSTENTNSAAVSNDSDDLSNSSVINDLRSKRAQCGQNLARLVALGVKISDIQGATVASYDEGLWASFEHDDKIRQALLIFCAKMPDSGHYTVMIEGLHDGKVKASVVDGDYIDN